MSIRLKNVDVAEGRATALGCPIVWPYLDVDGLTGNEAVIVAAATLPTAVGDTLEFTIAAQPNVPRTLTIELNQDANADYEATVRVWGRTIHGEYVRETFVNVTNAGGAFETNQAYKTVDKIEVENTSAATTTGTDQMRVGYGLAFALPVKIGRIEDVIWACTGLLAGAGTGANMVYLTHDATPTATEYSLDTQYHTITFGDTPDANEDMFVAVMSSYKDRNMLLDA